MTLMTELGMTKGFENPAHEALLNIYYTASKTRKKAGDFFRSFGLTDVQYNVMSLLKHQKGDQTGLTQVELSRMMLVNRANITTLIDRMEKANLVVRRPVPDDRRYNVIELTPHGYERYQQVSGMYKEQISGIMSAITPEESDALIRILGKIRTNLDELNGDE